MLPITRTDYFNIASEFCAPIIRFYNPNESQVQLPLRVTSTYSNEIADLECFARPLWAITGLVKNGDVALGRTVISMIRNGVDKSGRLYWGKVRDHDQMIVEMPSIAYFIYENNKLIKDTLDEHDIQSIAQWFSQINKVSYGENNWQFFGILINAILLKLEWGGSREKIFENWNRVNGNYLGNGWYTDGATKQRDYYIAFAYHFYSLLWLYIDPEMDNDIKVLIRERAEIFASNFRWFFDVNGASVPYGRSLIYRFAHVSFWAAYKLAGLTGVADSEIKCMISKNLDWWMHKDIYMPDRTLNVGYTYSNLFMTESYNAAGSPYWAFKTFVLLQIPEKDPFWDSPIKENMDNGQTRYIEKADFYIDRSDGSVLLYPLNHQACWEWETATSKYEKYAYSSRFGFCVPRGNETREGSGCDSSIAISYDSRHWISRHRSTDIKVDDSTYFSIWNADSFTQIKSWICIFSGWHVRVHIVETTQELSVMDCGFSVPASALAECRQGKALSLNDKENKLYSIVVALKGNGVARSFNASPNSNILFPKVQVPYVSIDVKPGQYTIIDGFYGGTGMPQEMPMISVKSNKVHVHHRDKDIEINLDNRPIYPQNTIERIKQKVKAVKRMLGR